MIKPTEPSLPISMPSYNFCAVVIVRFTEKPILRAASCCNFDVINGGTGLRLRSFVVTESTTNFSLFASSTIVCAVASSLMCVSFFFNSWSNAPVLTVLSSILKSLASKAGGNFAVKFAAIVQYSVLINFSISRSRSTTSRSATVCTLPADSLPPTFFHSSGETL